MNTELALSSPAAGGGTLDASSFPSSARWALRMLDRFSSGTLELTFPDGQRARFGAGSPQAHIRLHNWAPIQAALSSGDIGFAESFVSGDWSTDDPVRVRQIFRNLLANADRYGGPRIIVRVDRFGDVYALSVIDDGSGIPETERERIFDPYCRAHNQVGRTESVGLGLTVSRQLARLMNGDLSYDYRSGHSIFTVTLPAV